MIFENGDRIVFAGDSVTDMGSTNPVGEGLRDSLRHGYVRMVELFCEISLTGGQNPMEFLDNSSLCTKLGY